MRELVNRTDPLMYFRPDENMSAEHREVVSELFEKLSDLHRISNKAVSAVALLDHVFGMIEENERRSDEFEAERNKEIFKPRRDLEKFDAGRKEYSANFRLMHPWPDFVVMGLIVAIYDYRWNLESIGKWAKSAGVQDLIFKASVFEDSLKVFDKAFPHWKSMRHAVMHEDEIINKPDQNASKSKMNGVVSKPYGGSLLYVGNFEDRDFVTMRRGQLLRLDTTSSTVKKIHAIDQQLVVGCIAKQSRKPSQWFEGEWPEEIG